MDDDWIQSLPVGRWSYQSHLDTCLRVLTLREHQKIDYYSVKALCDMQCMLTLPNKKNYVTMQGIRKMFVDILTSVCLLPVFSMFREFSLPQCYYIVKKSILNNLLNNFFGESVERYFHTNFDKFERTMFPAGHAHSYCLSDGSHVVVFVCICAFAMMLGTMMTLFVRLIHPCFVFLLMAMYLGSNILYNYCT